MKYLDYFLFKIYNTYSRVYKMAPKILRDPPFMSSVITAAYCSALLVSLAIRLNFLGKSTGFYLKFFSIFLILLICTILSLYLERRAKKVYHRFINESKKQKIVGAVCVNTVIVLIIALFVTMVN